MKTKRGIELNLKESNYKTTIEGFTFYFSSEYYLDKFIKGYDSFLNLENAKISVKHQFYINLKIYLLFSYYRKIEKRGFRIVEEATKEELSNNVRFISTLIRG